jgi:hypothetical protein
MELYRGLSHFVEDGVVENPHMHNPRKPRDTALNIHRIADEWFYEKFGIKARSQSVFCTTDIGQAKEYRHQGSLLKINLHKDAKYTLIYSPDVDDFLEHTEVVNIDGDDMTQWLDRMEYISINDISLLPDYHMGEVMLYCEEYEVVNV